ncbi:MAG: hypothetical protein ACLQNG_07455 [Acidimicrobiales bacterium]
MLRQLSKAGLCAAVLSMAVVAVSATASAASTSGARKVGPHQHFYGRVNGHASNAGITVVCTTSGAGEILDGQTIEVLSPPTATDNDGYTGRRTTSIEALLEYSRGTISVLQPLAKFSRYGVKKAIPGLSVPCGGTGFVVFTPDGSHVTSFSVTVSFLNVAVAPVTATTPRPS